ncbi:SH3 domain-containing protein [Sulfurospirillum barnesii]|uniref:NlpC/P60 family protein n=1 Tax=Sulfurospirillum barnesii (strain ATCC 700032 / DSM 10660 / SES-3) TaxID=760154 RepID=I3XXU6_SULBS|nr:SH3 domain-containing protein [Sulfurospirillum barnesii]AFL68770.1 NlpC/P60 family protein [Sulfurospirillum barnesii SES-3]
MTFRTLFLFTCNLLLFSGCAIKEPLLRQNEPYAPSTQSLVQNIVPQNIAQDDFTYRYYKPWFKTHLSHKKEDASWANKSYGIKGRYYGENLQLIGDDEVDALLKSTNFEAHGSVNAHAIMLQNEQMRNLPTHKPFFKKTTLPGEGYPFDYLQTSRIHIAEPILISHYSRDGAWAYVESSFAAGWLPSNSFVWLDAKERTPFIKALKIAIVQDNVPLYNAKQHFVSYAKVGAIFPIENEDDNFFYTFIYTKDANEEASKLTLFIPKSFAKKVPLEFSQESIHQLSNTLLGEKYGWGGYLNNRDCSAMTRDFLAPFGVWIPRNSAAQKSFGEYISLKDLSPKEKEAMILKHGIAFLSLIYLKGHIMLYAGEVQEKPFVMHNVWGVKTLENGKEGRDIIGKAVITDLYVGANQPNVPEASLLINRVEGILVKPTYATKNNLVSKYPSVKAIKDNNVYFMDGSTLPYDDKQAKHFDELLENADIEDMFTQTYPAFFPITPPTLNDDPGRFRNDAFLKKLYGESKKEIEKNLTEVIWLPNHGAKKLKFNQNENAAMQLQKVSDELDRLPEKYMKYLKNPAGTYAYRPIAGTSRLSAHSYGIAIDLETSYSRYWRWDKTYTFHNEFPKEIIDIFEKHGFVWGGRWYHYDTMHFEYRPELFESID